MENTKLTEETNQHMKRMVDSLLDDLTKNGLLFKVDEDIFETEKGDSETVYSLSLLIANDLADTHEKEGSVEKFQDAVLDYIYNNHPCYF